MPKRRQSELVGGYEVFKALNQAQQKAAKRGGKRRDSSNGRGSDSGSGKSRQKSGMASNIGHTALPPKHRLVCFECGYKFEITGHTESIQCPKCRVEISLRDVTIDKNWTESIKTGGSIEIKKGAVIKGGELIAKNVLLNGRLEGGSINAYNRLIVQADGVYDEERIEAMDLLIEPDATVKIKNTAHFENLHISGTLSAKKVCVAELISVGRGALLSGTFEAKRLQLEEGGGLKAKVKIQGISSTRMEQAVSADAAEGIV